MTLTTYLPAGLARDDVRACIGLIADTHAPQRWPGVPPVIADIFQGVDLILHAGDVGELWVLDRLSQIAPVIAVHGNDDTPDAQRELPYQQLLTVGGARLLLWHSHFPDYEEEMAFRQFDTWEPKLQRQADRARRAGARLIIYGHTHIPMARHEDGILIVNPGAIASGNHFLRQIRQTVALLFLRRDGAPFVSHVDLAAPGRPYTPFVDWGRGFMATMPCYNESLLAPDLEEPIARLRARQSELDDFVAFLRALEPFCHRCWSGERPHLTRDHLLQAIASAPDMSAADKALVRALLEG